MTTTAAAMLQYCSTAASEWRFIFVCQGRFRFFGLVVARIPPVQNIPIIISSISVFIILNKRATTLHH